MSRFTYRELEKCAAREVALRRNVYEKRGWTADRAREIAMMQEIEALLKDLADGEPSPRDRARFEAGETT